jgi:hypothetical protein
VLLATGIVIGAGVLLFPRVGFQFIATICERAGCVSSSTLRTHNDNMAKAEAFRQAMERDMPAGAAFDDVLGYLRARSSLRVGRLDRSAGPTAT